MTQPSMTELARQVMMNDKQRLKSTRKRKTRTEQVKFLRLRGWKHVGPCQWQDWLTGKTYGVKQAYHIELERGLIYEKDES